MFVVWLPQQTNRKIGKSKIVFVYLNFMLYIQRHILLLKI
nr:MAG TPA: hypothetical protein [Caudoviricetes sp.]